MPLSRRVTCARGRGRLGGNNVWAEWFAGRLDDVRIYNRALSAAQVQTDMGVAVG